MKNVCLTNFLKIYNKRALQNSIDAKGENQDKVMVSLTKEKYGFIQTKIIDLCIDKKI